MTEPDLHRYHRQMLLPDIGAEGQRRLREAHALVVGCGALGSVIVDQLARAGVGTLTIVDRDLVELTNLQRQVLFEESHVRDGVPKAEAARARIAAINGDVEVRACVEDFNATSAERLAGGADILLDGLDNFETRYLLNDLAVKRGLPYVYGGAVGTTGMSLPILPAPRHRAEGAAGAVTWPAEQSTPCLRCIFPQAPPPGTTATCDTAGILGPVVALVASHQSTEAIKILTGNLDRLERRMLNLDVWANESRRFDVSAAGPEAHCICCGEGRFEFLEGRSGSATTSLCGREAVQVMPETATNGERGHIDLATLATRLAPHGTFTHNEHILRGELAHEQGEQGRPIELTVFTDGRAIVKGTTEPAMARSVYAKYVGA